MALAMRLKRFGRKGYAQYRVVVADSRSPRDGGVVEELGSYDPHQEDNEKKTVLKKDRVAYWLQQGSQPTGTVKNLLKKQGILV